MALKCPHCVAEMNEVAAPTSVGYSIVLDQCPRCGGIWCDRWELYPLSAAAVDGLDSVDQTALLQPAVLTNDQLECPRCRARLRRFCDPSLPRDAHIERCPNCDGMWLNRGELRRFMHRTRAGGSTKTVMTETQLEQLVRQTSPSSAPRAAPVSHLADAFEAGEPVPESSEVRKEILSGVTWLIARTVLRLLLHV
jgi:Zn-finger nucleic acid-binding protein